VHVQMVRADGRPLAADENVVRAGTQLGQQKAIVAPVGVGLTEYRGDGMTADGLDPHRIGIKVDAVGLHPEAENGSAARYGEPNLTAGAGNGEEAVNMGNLAQGADGEELSGFE